VRDLLASNDCDMGVLPCVITAPEDVHTLAAAPSPIASGSSAFADDDGLRFAA
jgi:hypothetical protein